MARDVVITGVGPVSAIGIGREDVLQGLRRGESGIAEVTAFEVAEDGPALAAEVVGLDVDLFLRSAKNYLDRHSQLAFAAFELARRDAALDLEAEDATRIGLATGTEWGNMATLDTFCRAVAEKGPRLAPPFLFPHTYANTSNSLLSIEYDIKGFNQNFAGFAGSGGEALACAFAAVADGLADVVFAGGVDALCGPLYAAYAAAGELSPGEDGCRPFAPDRDGRVLGEGAAFVVMESADHARARNARTLARVTAATRAGNAADALRRLSGAQPVALFAAADGSVDGDATEAEAIVAALGKAAQPVTATKSLFGDTLGASGPLALVAALGALELGRVPRTATSAACAFDGMDLCLENRPLAAGPILVQAAAGRGQGIALALARTV